jgi:hypothetical protein
MFLVRINPIVVKRCFYDSNLIDDDNVNRELVDTLSKTNCP